MEKSMPCNLSTASFARATLKYSNKLTKQALASSPAQCWKADFSRESTTANPDFRKAITEGNGLHSSYSASRKPQTV